MKRIFFLTGMAAVVTTALCLFLLNKFILIFAILLLLVMFSLLFFRHKNNCVKPMLLILAAVFLFCVRYVLFYNFQLQPIVQLQGSYAKAEMLVLDVKTQDNRLYVTGKVTKNGRNMPSDFKTSFYYTDETLSLAAGDRISAELSYTALSAHAKNASYSRGVYIFCKAKDLKILSSSKTAAYYLSVLRTFISERLFTFLPYDTAALMNGLLLSDISYLRPSVYTDLQRCGLLHLTAVSGTHLSVFCYSIFRLLQRRLSKRTSAWLTLPPVLLVMAIAGFTPSVTRAGIMALLYLIGTGMYKRADPLNSLGVAAAVMLFYNPCFLLGKGFVLSFSAMLGMLLIAPRLSACVPIPRFKFRFVNVTVQALLSAFICTVAASVCTVPAGIIFFGEISLLSPLLNVLCTFPAMFCMMLGAFAVLFPFLFYLMRPLLAFILWITGIFSGFSAASVNAAPPYVSLWVAAVLILLGVILLLKQYKPVLCVLLSVMLLLVSVLSYMLLDIDVVHIAVSNTREGISVMIVKNRSCMIIGMGGKDVRYKVSDYCNARSVQYVPFVLFPSYNTAYYNVHALQNKDYNTVLVPPDRTAELKTLAGMEKTVLKLADMEVVPFKNFKVKVVAAGNGYVVQWKADEITGLICMGTDTVPKSLYGANYLITDTAVPACYTGEKTKVILAADSAEALPLVSDVSNRGMEAYVVDTDETAELLIRSGKTEKLIKL